MRAMGRSSAGRIVMAAVVVPIAARIARRVGQGIQQRQSHSKHGQFGGFGMGSRRQQHGFLHR